MVQGCTKIPGGECHRHEKGFRKETMRFGISVIFSIFGMDASRCTDELWQFFRASDRGRETIKGGV